MESIGVVSILVLMDITLLLVYGLRLEEILKGFNPCFNGYYTFTSSNVKNVTGFIMFQSLF